MIWIVPALVVFACVISLLGLARPHPYPDVPAFFQHTQGAGGWSSDGCPLPPDQKTDALSPDLTPRLNAAFPEGSDPNALRDFVVNQGFQMRPPCEGDPAIQRASFSQLGGSFGHPTFHATVAWKADSDGRLMWTKGYVFYSSY